MTIDGVIQNEENDGDGFNYGGWFFPYADEVTGAGPQGVEGGLDIGGVARHGAEA